MVIVALARVITAVSGLAVMALLTRHLGPSAFGEYRTVLAYTSYAYLTSDLGLYAYTLRAISEPGADKHLLVGRTLKLRVVLAIAFLLVATVLSLGMPFSPVVQLGIALATAGYVLHGASDLLLAAFQNQLRQYEFAMTEVVGGLITLLLAYLVVRSNLGTLAAVGTLVGGFVVTFGINAYLLRNFIQWNAPLDRPTSIAILTASLPFAGALVLGLIYSRLDIVFLSLMQSPDDVGIYGIAHKVSDVAIALPYFFAGLVLPALTASVGNQKKFAHILSRSLTAMCVAGLGATLVIVLFADVFIELLAGPAFAAGASALKIIGVKIGLFFIANMLVFTTTALGLQQRMLRGHAVAAVASVIGYLFLIPRLSYDGAAIAATLAEVVVLIFALYLVISNAGKVLQFSVFLKCVAAAASAWILMTQTQLGSLHWLAKLCLVGLIYLTLIVAFRTGAWSAVRDVLRR